MSGWQVSCRIFDKRFTSQYKYNILAAGEATVENTPADTRSTFAGPTNFSTAFKEN